MCYSCGGIRTVSHSHTSIHSRQLATRYVNDLCARKWISRTLKWFITNPHITFVSLATATQHTIFNVTICYCPMKSIKQKHIVYYMQFGMEHWKSGKKATLLNELSLSRFIWENPLRLSKVCHFILSQFVFRHNIFFALFAQRPQFWKEIHGISLDSYLGGASKKRHLRFNSI